ncbi:MAG TPA: hypothetical protein VN429_00765 [Methanospirillum sp.]|uniref:hypothetical protein n=1 Tax=Methanospirillum sp. TaxID=45200 RepID=UPI002CA974D8|nr:hypothetical protein [Methanospirillum sp.]HWQ62915.1 hypothetical protein [Methanospirillum sp.]
MRSLNNFSRIILVWFGCISSVLLAGSNWNNAGYAEVGYLNSNNTVSYANPNISTQLELKTVLSSPEQQSDLNQIDYLVKQKANLPGVSVLLGTLSRMGRAES